MGYFRPQSQGENVQRTYDRRAKFRKPCRGRGQVPWEGSVSAKEIEVLCPCCQSRLSIDVLTAKVLRHEPAGAGSASADRWASAQDRVRGRTTSGTEKLDRALDSERGKKDRLDDLFRKAQEKLKRPDDE